MDNKASRVPTLIALGLSTLSFALVAIGWFIGRNEVADSPGTGSALWIYSVIAAACALLLYIRDAVHAILPTKDSIHPRFNLIRSTVLFLGLPLGLYFGLQPGWNILIWNGYHVVMCGFEIAWLLMEQKEN